MTGPPRKTNFLRLSSQGAQTVADGGVRSHATWRLRRWCRRVAEEWTKTAFALLRVEVCEYAGVPPVGAGAAAVRAAGLLINLLVAEARPQTAYHLVYARVV